ncbi:hypothetical protein [Pseudomonas trivialis]
MDSRTVRVAVDPLMGWLFVALMLVVWLAKPRFGARCRAAGVRALT